MTYGYLRVSTDQQDENNQRVGVDNKAKSMQVQINEYIVDKVSGTKEPEKRQLGKLMEKLKRGDLIIISELSRLGRSMYMVMRILEYCMKSGIRVVTVKDNYVLGDDIQSKVLAFTFSIAAEIERDMISKRTKEALSRCKANGIKLGRKPGKQLVVRLSGHEEEIKSMLCEGKDNIEIGKRFGVHRATVRFFIRDRMKIDVKSLRVRVCDSKLTVRGETKTLLEWCEFTGMSLPAIKSRIKSNWSPEKIIDTPVNKNIWRNR